MIKHFREEFEARIDMRREENGLGAAIRRSTAGATPAAGRCAEAEWHRPDGRGGLRVDATPRDAGRDVHASTVARSRPAENADARRRRQVRRRRDPGLLLRAEAGSACRRLPHAPGRDRGHPEAADRLLDPVKDGMVVHTRPSASTRRSARWSSSCSSTTRSTAPSATRAASARCRTSPTAWLACRASSSRSATSRSCSSCRRSSRSIANAASSSTARVRFSQEIAEDYELILLERGAHSFVGTFDGIARRALQRQHRRAVPGRRVTSSAVPLPRAPVGHRGRGSICTFCPAQCNVELTVRDERVMRVLARDHDEVDDGWLCRQGPLRHQHVHVDERTTEPLVREGEGADARELGEGARRRRQRIGQGRRPRRRARRGRDDDEEAFLLQRLFREGLGSGHLAARAGGELPLDVTRALADPRRRRASRTSSSPTPSSCSVRPGRRRRSSTCAPQGRRRDGVRVVVASARPTRSTRAPTSSCAPRRAPARPCSSRSTPRSPTTSATSAAPRAPPARTPTASRPSPRR